MRLEVAENSEQQLSSHIHYRLCPLISDRWQPFLSLWGF
jgi:hypothetical protein